jgi:hypothetical protein
VAGNQLKYKWRTGNDLLVLPWEEGFAVEHLCKDAAYGPDIDGFGVHLE